MTFLQAVKDWRLLYDCMDETIVNKSFDSLLEIHHRYTIKEEGDEVKAVKLLHDKLHYISAKLYIVLLSDLKNAGSLIESNLKEQLGPLASGLKTMFDSFIGNLLQQQQQQESGIMTYLPIIRISSIGLIFFFNKK